jgi:hypothetical protein
MRNAHAGRVNRFLASSSPLTQTQTQSMASVDWIDVSSCDVLDPAGIFATDNPAPFVD